MKAVITGGHGFLGWHLACRLRALYGIQAQRLDRVAFNDPNILAKAVSGADVIFHLAGVNRASAPEDVESGNVSLARALSAATNQSNAFVVYANSIHADRDDHYGRGKRRAAEILDSSSQMANVMLPNIFGERGRPLYNSFVATFCAQLRGGDDPQVHIDSEVPLLHAQDAAEYMIQAALSAGRATLRPEGQVERVSGVLERLIEFERIYSLGEIPEFRSRFDLDLFNTLRSYGVRDRYPIYPKVNSDERGDLFECLRAHGGESMVYASTTKPGKVRGEHYHLQKIERFSVVSGEALIEMRPLFSTEVLRFQVSGDRPSIVDMPTMWVHRLVNIGSDDLLTVFWSDQLLNRERPDQFPAFVEDDENA